MDPTYTATSGSVNHSPEVIQASGLHKSTPANLAPIIRSPPIDFIVTDHPCSPLGQLVDISFSGASPVEVPTTAFHDKTASLELNQKFQSLAIAKTFVKSVLERDKIHYKIQKSCPKRFLLECPVQKKQCAFQLVIITNTNLVTFIKAINLNHSCGTSQTSDHISKDVCILLTKDLVKINRKTPPSVIQHSLQEKHGLSISYSKASHIKNSILDSSELNSKDSFSQIQDFFDNVALHMPGSTGLVFRGPDDVFQNSFLLLEASKIAFPFCRPLLFIDAYPIENSFDGIMMTASTFDGDNQIVPIAIGTGGIESESSWTWFLLLLKKYLNFPQKHGDRPNFIFFSKRNQEIADSLKNVFPEFQHSHSAFHISKAVMKNCGATSLSLIINAAQAPTYEKFDESMEVIKTSHPNIHFYLSNIPPSSWSQAHSPAPTFGAMEFNFDESVNRWVEELSDLSHLWINVRFVRKVMEFSLERKAQHELTLSALLPTHQQLLLQNMALGERMGVIGSSLTYTAVSNGLMEFSIDLTNLKCSCGISFIWQFPCPHAMAAIKVLKLDPFKYIHTSYFTSSFMKTYSSRIVPVIASNLKRDSTKPPIKEKKPGRPKRKRSLSPDGPNKSGGRP